MIPKEGVRQYPPRNILAGVHGSERFRWWSNREMVGEMEELGVLTPGYLLYSSTARPAIESCS
jgi:hypothetical protein